MAAPATEPHRPSCVTARPQGSGTFAVESVITTTVPRDHAKLVVIHNGAYGQRIVSIAKVLNIPVVELEVPERELPDVAKIEALLRATPGVTNVAMVHCETSSGMFNPVEAVGRLVHAIHPSASCVLRTRVAWAGRVCLCACLAGWLACSAC